MRTSGISCIVPVFNGEKYLEEALDSILSQTYPPLEIIIADDGSTDGTPGVVARYGDRVRYLRQDNVGPAAARNLGLEAGQGEFVAFLDADDRWHPEKLERQMARFEIRAELGCSVSHVQNFWISELSGEEDKFRDHRIAKPLPGYVCGTLLARRRVFDEIGPFNADLGHGDAMDWFLRAREKHVVVELLSDVLLYRRLHHSNRIRALGSSSREQFLGIVKGVIDRRRQKMT